jgi:hypothetical protein
MLAANCSMLEQPTEGVRLLRSEVSRIRTEGLRTILLDYYLEHKPRPIRKRHTGETDRDGNKITEEVFAGADKLGQVLQADADQRNHGA